ncbi:helix-turn-helix domain-containing protein [Desulfovibrio falkowii]|uniref:helix-turn-helix domain-containing protein n=1 Tax=Desulfovibrio sp. WGS1351 TaxID=3366814 RepID=UPI00372D6729
MEEYRRQLGTQIKKVRKARGLSQDMLQERSGVTKSYISDVETGKAKATVDTLKKLADGIGVPVGEFFRFELGPVSVEELKSALIQVIKGAKDDASPAELHEAMMAVFFKNS